MLPNKASLNPVSSRLNLLLFHEEFLQPAWAQANRFANLGENLKIPPGKNPGILKVRVESIAVGKIYEAKKSQGSH